MTTTQVRYWEYREAKRHNVVDERLSASQISESKRHNLATEKQGLIGLKIDTLRLKETNRHNVATERLTATELAERQRHNIATESLTASEIAESIRHNQAQEYETHRSNIARETEIHRSNVASERLRATELGIKADKVKAKLAQVGVEKTKAQIDKAYKEAMTNIKSKEFTRDTWFGVADRFINVLGINTRLAGGLVKSILPILMG